MITKVFERIYSIPIRLPHNPLRNLNCYFIRGWGRHGKNLLIDTGFNMPECREDLRKGLSELNADLTKTDLFLTHLHADHTGLAAELEAAGAHILMGETDFAMLRKYKYDGPWRKCFPEYLGLGASEQEMELMMASTPARKYISSPFHAELVQNGDSLFYGGYHLTCVAAPGHTPGHICLYDAADRLMFLGDHVLFDITPNVTVWPEVKDSLGDYLNSLRKMEAYDVEIPLPAHRTTNGISMGTRVNELLVHHERRLGESYALLCRQPRQTCYQIAAQMTWKIRADDWSQFPPGQKIFALGETKSHLDHLVCSGKARCERSPDGNWRYSAVQRDAWDR
ncbi:MAG: MBL fold metallo-hydrolase [Oscillospiraceae bacterium]|jgi:glyoxylase-like metal-dependent hydrolase (beta-lactamase superfamily II)|nr:MBL fold metallo-hydrolase [Oscillospiraceae bacterium]